MTGVAATVNNAQTLHSTLGIGVPKYLHDLRKAFAKDDEACKAAKLVRASTLVIDEVSMLSGELLDAIDDLLREAACYFKAAYMDRNDRRYWIPGLGRDGKGLPNTENVPHSAVCRWCLWVISSSCNLFSNAFHRIC